MHTNTVFFSIIIPTFNRAHVLAKAIESVLQQRYTNWELIIIDDGSTDNTQQVVQQFSDDRINYVYQENTERSQARNNGIKLAKGLYICFLDSDDEYCDNHLVAFYEFIRHNTNPIALLFSNPIVIIDGKEIKEEVAVFNEEDALTYILKNSVIPDRVCIHHAIFEQYKFNPDIHIGEDTILWAQITNSFQMYHIDAFTVKYHVHDDNSVNLKRNVYKNRLDGLMELFNDSEIKKRLHPQLKTQMMSVCYFGIARHYELKRNFINMAVNALYSVMYDIKNPQTKAKLYMIYSYFKRK